MAGIDSPFKCLRVIVIKGSTDVCRDLCLQEINACEKVIRSRDIGLAFVVIEWNATSLPIQNGQLN